MRSPKRFLPSFSFPANEIQIRSLAVVLLVGFLAATLTAQDKKSSEDKQSSVKNSKSEKHDNEHDHASHAPSDAASQIAQAHAETIERDPEFEAAFKKWKDIAREIFETREQYNIVSKQESKTVRNRWQSLVKQGDEAIKNLYHVGIEVYDRRKEKDPRIGFFLMEQAITDVESRNYSRANRVFKMLEDSKLIYDKTSISPAGVAAFVLNDFERAQNLFDAAKEHGTLNAKYSADGIAKTLPEVAREWEQELVWRKREKANDDLPLATIVTTKGEIKIELFENDAPNTVAHFIKLAENSFYDDNYFNAPNFAIMMTGSPTIDGKGVSPHQIKSEATKDLYRGMFRGSLIMWHEGADRLCDSRFAICKRPLDIRNFGFVTCFGRVLSGMDIVDKLQTQEQVQSIVEIDKVISVTITRKRDHDYKVERVGDDVSSPANTKE